MIGDSSVLVSALVCKRTHCNHDLRFTLHHVLDECFRLADAEGAVDLAAQDIGRQRVEVEFDVIVVNHHFVEVEIEQLAVHLTIA